jgi:hypothetical protein
VSPPADNVYPTTKAEADPAAVQCPATEEGCRCAGKTLWNVRTFCPLELKLTPLQLPPSRQQVYLPQV